MKIKEVAGIDVSKATLDVFIHSTGQRNVFDNWYKGHVKLMDWVLENSGSSKENILFVLEHTGLYSHNVSGFLASKGLSFHMVSGLEVKRSLGITRGKSDQVDAQRIAQYAYRLREELVLRPNTDIRIKRLKAIFSLRTKIVRQRAGFKATLKEQQGVLDHEDYQILFDVQKNLIGSLSNEILKLEKEMMGIVKEDKELIHMYGLITGIKGVGKMSALLIIIYTNRFTKFKTWRKFASYSGTAPFPHQSGTSVNGRSKVSHFANKEIKSMLNMCAISAIQHNTEMSLYYQRRTEQGKNKMSTLNIIRNKLIARIFAVVKRGTAYEATIKLAS